MVDSTFDFTSAYNLQLIDYFNNLTTVLQCDSESGQQREETSVIFEQNSKIIDILVSCDEKNREDCFEYCQEFKFTNFDSIWDVDHEKVLKLFKFVNGKIENMGKDKVGKFNIDGLRVIYSFL